VKATKPDVAIALEKWKIMHIIALEKWKIDQIIALEKCIYHEK
jgi:hypothetical protein